MKASAATGTDPGQATHGFTIIEMLVVLTIMSMAMAAAPALLSGLDSNRLRAASLELIGRLREIRGQAANAQTTTEIAFDLNRRGFVVSTDPAFHALPSVVDGLDVTPTALIGPGRIARIRFLPDGSATGARISLRHGSLTATIVIDWLTGRVWRDG